MGSFITQELMLARPDMVRQAVLMATHGRRDCKRELFHGADLDLAEPGVQLPPRCDATVRPMESFSPKPLNDDDAVRGWINMLTLYPMKFKAGYRCQVGVMPDGDRVRDYRAIPTP